MHNNKLHIYFQANVIWNEFLFLFVSGPRNPTTSILTYAVQSGVWSLFMRCLIPLVLTSEIFFPTSSLSHQREVISANPALLLHRLMSHVSNHPKPLSTLNIISHYSTNTSYKFLMQKK